MSALPKPKYSVEDYIELDRHAEGRYEYFDGVVVELSGASLNHNRIVSNLSGNLRNALAGRNCEVLPADMRLKVPAAFPYRYPDVVVICGEPAIEQMQGLDLLTNPLLIVEVLSPTTEGYDRGHKFSAYQSIESFREYLLVAQDRPHVVQYVRQLNGRWLRADVSGLESGLALESIHVTLYLSEIYQRVQFETF